MPAHLALALLLASAHANPGLDLCKQIRDVDDKSREYVCQAMVTADVAPCRRVDADDHPARRLFCEVLYRKVKAGSASCTSLATAGASRARTLGISPEDAEGLADSVSLCKAYETRNDALCTRSKDLEDRRACVLTVQALQAMDAPPDARRLETGPTDTGGPTVETDPITGERFEHPVIARDGRTYERDTLLAYLRTHDGTLPDGTPNRADQLVRDQSMYDRADADEDDALLDPITMVEMTDPLVASDGYTYDRSTLRRLLADGGTSPFTRAKLEPVAIRNGALAQRIAEKNGGTAPSGSAVVLVDTRHLAAEDLRRVDLAGLDLRAARLGGAQLSGTSLNRTDLREADLRRARLGPHVLHGDEAAEADPTSPLYVAVDNRDGGDLVVHADGRVTGATMIVEGAHYRADARGLRRTDLRAADLQAANLGGADLAWASLRSARLDEASLANASLNNADLTGASLHMADLSGALLMGANLRGARLSAVGAGARDAEGLAYWAPNDPRVQPIVEDGRIVGARVAVNLTDADLSDALMDDADLSHAVLEGARLGNASLTGAVLAGANLRGADLAGADLRHADFSGADLTGADLRATKRDGARFDGAVLTDAQLPWDFE